MNWLERWLLRRIIRRACIEDEEQVVADIFVEEFAAERDCSTRVARDDIASRIWRN